jgi:hypothetical protein
MIRWILVVTWLLLAVVLGLWDDLFHSYGWFYPLFIFLCCPPIFAVAGLIAGQVKASAKTKAPPPNKTL